MTYVIINIAVVAVIWVGAEQADSGIITQGKVIALVNYMSQILVELIKMANLIIIISKAVACMNRVDSIFKVESSIEDKGGTAPGNPVLRIPVLRIPVLRIPARRIPARRIPHYGFPR